MNIQSTPSVSRRETWFRLLFVLLFVLLYSLAEIVLLAVVAIQFGFVLIRDQRNRHLLTFGAGLSKYSYQILRFMTFNSEDKPFPFASWPCPSSSPDSTSNFTSDSTSDSTSHEQL